MTETFGAEYRVRLLDDASEGRWDAFVDACPEATFFHRAGWRRIIEGSFGHACHYLYAEKNGAIAGVLPLAHIRSWLFGKSLISNAFCVYGGPAAANDSARRILTVHAENLAQELGVDYLEYRGRVPRQSDWARNEDLYVSFRKDIDPEPEKNLLAVPRKQRAMIRKGIKAGLVSEIDDDTARLYPVYAASVRNLGTPVFGRRYFAAIKEVFGGDCEVLTVSHGGRPVASVMSFYFRDEVHPYYGGGTADARAVAGNDFMYWEVMRRASESGYRVFDFGRSKRGTGSFAFKKHWGFEPAPLSYEFKLFRGDEVPAINPLNPKYRLFIAMWKRLPLPVANLIGPRLARIFG